MKRVCQYFDIPSLLFINFIRSSEVFYDDTCAEAESYTQQVYLNFVNGIGYG